MPLKSLFTVFLAAILVVGCGAADESDESANLSTKVESATSEMTEDGPEQGETSSIDARQPPDNTENPDAPASAVDSTDRAVDGAVGAAEGAGKKPKSKFLITYDEKRKKTFIPKCETEMAQDLKPNQISEACDCLFEELTDRLDGIKERLNPPDDKIEAVNEICLSKYI